ncbi:MAG: hypothetical protein HGA45_04545 [Chloroflexales bacterium]|nr:hypothetical protein [Chloroflexales bacterium]
MLWQTDSSYPALGARPVALILSPVEPSPAAAPGDGAPQPTALPQPANPLIGRADELAALRALL